MYKIFERTLYSDVNKDMFLYLAHVRWLHFLWVWQMIDFFHTSSSHTDCKRFCSSLLAVSSSQEFCRKPVMSWSLVVSNASSSLSRWVVLTLLPSLPCWQPFLIVRIKSWVYTKLVLLKLIKQCLTFSPIFAICFHEC